MLLTSTVLIPVSSDTFLIIKVSFATVPLCEVTVIATLVILSVDSVTVSSLASILASPLAIWTLAYLLFATTLTRASLLFSATSAM